MLTLTAIAEVLGGVVEGPRAKFPTPGHSSTDRGSWAEIIPGAPDDLLIRCSNSTDEKADAIKIKDRLREAGVLPPRETAQPKRHAVKLQPGQRIVATFEFRDPAGVLLYRKHRIEPGPDGRGKEFRFDRPNGDGWKAGAGDRRVPYRSRALADAAAGDTIFLAEGEAKADRLAGWGLVASSLKDWKPAFAPFIADRNIVILPDNDETGEKQARAMADHARAAGARAVIVPLPRLATKGDDIMDWDGDAEELRALATEALRDRPASRLPVELFGEIRPQLDHRHLIDGLVPTGALVVMFGHPGSGKSFAALDMGLHIAAAREWMDRPVAPGGVIYIAAEGQGGLRLRIEAWRLEYQPPAELPFALIPVAVDLLDARADMAGLEAVLADLAARWGGIALIVIDTLTATFGGGDENGADMAAFVGNVARLRQPHGCTALIVHHQPLNGDSKRPRGHGSLWGAADTVLHVEGDATAPARRIRVTKQKDTDPARDILFALRKVDIGEDQQGRTVDSCVIEPVRLDAAQPADRQAVAIAKLPDKPKIALDQLDDALRVHGITPPADIPDEEIDRIHVGKVVDYRTWSDKCIAALRTGPDIKTDSARRSFDRAKDRLQADKIIKVFRDWAWRRW